LVQHPQVGLLYTVTAGSARTWFKRGAADASKANVKIPVANIPQARRIFFMVLSSPEFAIL
jgi:hypothetical protein